MEDALAQAIIVLETDEAQYTDIIIASATASQRCTIQEDKYLRWLSSGQRKTVRRASEKLFKKIISELEESSLDYYIIEHPVATIAVEPILYSEFLKGMRRAQVSGFKPTFDSTEIVTKLSYITSGSFVMNASLEMPVGKAAVQYAHAIHMFREFFAREPIDTRLIFANHKIFEKVKLESNFTVTDSGLTVFNAPTDTVCYI